MKKDSRIYILSVATAFAILLALFLRQRGGNQIRSNPQQDMLYTQPPISESQPPLQAVDHALIQQVSPTASVCWSCRYSLCGHSHICYNAEAIIGLTRDEIEEAFPSWELVKYDKRNVALRSSHDGYCPQHYILKYAKGELCIFTVEEITHNLNPYMPLSISADVFPLDTLNALKAGIAFDTLQEVDLFIEAHDS